MTVTTSALLMNTGRLSATFVVPLDAPAYDLGYHGSLGPMPAESLNRFIDNVFAVRIAGGQIEGIDFRATATSGHLRGWVQPRYAGFGIAITGVGAHGALARGGTIGHLIRSVASTFANSTKIRADNPAKAGDAPRVGVIDHVYQSPPEQLVSFVWLGLRDGLLAVVRK